VVCPCLWVAEHSLVITARQRGLPLETLEGGGAYPAKSESGSKISRNSGTKKDGVNKGTALKKKVK
jgi:hypothetical protein